MPPSRSRRAAAQLRRCSSLLTPCLGAVAALLASTGSSGNAIANGETRSLEIYHTHTHENATITYKRNGQFDRDGLEKLNWMLRDWRRDEPTSMDPRLFDIVWEVRREVGSSEPLNIVSAYRAPETNAMLRRRSRAVAKHSQHMLGKAMDFFLPDVPMSKVREVGLRLQRGGVGYYPTAFNPFVHLDAGSVRHWPRMTRDQLARVFPDGKTVHIPADGRPMPGYDLAAAEIERNGGSVSAYADAGDEDTGFFSGRKGKSFFAALFGGRDDAEQEQEQARAQVVRRSDRLARAETRQQAAPKVEPYENFVQPSPEPEEPPPAKPVAVASLEPQQAAAPDVPPPAKAVARAGAQPQLVWQAGPDAPQDGEADAASVPMPLARPADLALSLIPLPPARPVEMASLTGLRTTPDAIGVAEEISAPPSSSAYAPLPPPRPASAPPPARIAALPAPAPKAAPAPAPIPALVQQADLDRTGLKSLFAAVSLAGPRVARGAAPVHTARTRTATRDLTGVTRAPSSSVVMSFGKRDDLTSDHFSGPAVRPLDVARYTP